MATTIVICSFSPVSFLRERLQPALNRYRESTWRKHYGRNCAPKNSMMRHETLGNLDL